MEGCGKGLGSSSELAPNKGKRWRAHRDGRLGHLLRDLKPLFSHDYKDTPMPTAVCPRFCPVVAQRVGLAPLQTCRGNNAVHLE